MIPTSTEQPAWYRGPAFQLLVVLTGIYLIGAFLSAGPLNTQLVNLLTAATVILSLRELTESRRAFRIGIGIMLVLLASSHILHAVMSRETYVWDTVVTLVFFLFPVVALTRSLARSKRVNTDAIFAASCLYLLMGICFGFGFVLIYQADPAAFTLSAEDALRPESSLIHFSFTTLTTVGYGAISPISRSARALSDIEAIIAQLYLAVILARLVSLQISHGGHDHRAT